MTQGRKASTDKSPESLFLHCQTAYKGMLSSAKGRVMFNDETGQEETIIVWEGMLTQFITGELHLSVPYYTKITRELKRMGCIEQLKRGGGTAPSQWRLLTEPTEEAWAKNRAKKKQSQGPQAANEQKFADLNKRVGRLEQAFERVLQEAQDE